MADEHNTESKREHEKRKAFVKFAISLVIFLLASVFLAVSGMIIPAILTALLFCGCLFGFVGNLKGRWKSVDGKFPEKKQPVVTDEPKEKTEEEKKIIRGTEMSLEILSGLTLEAESSIQEDFSADAEKFYSSAESRDAGRCRAYRSEKEKIWKKMLTDHVLRKLEKEHNDIFKAFQAGQEKRKKSEAEDPMDIYYSVKTGMLDSLGFKGTDYSRIGSKPQLVIQKCETRIYRMSEEKAKKLWRPIHVLSGSYGSYTDCICFDEEMKVFFRLSPDDNYYHWGGYDLFCISEDQARAELRREMAWNEDPEERDRYQFTEADPEFISRI